MPILHVLLARVIAVGAGAGMPMLHVLLTCAIAVGAGLVLGM